MSDRIVVQADNTDDRQDRRVATLMTAESIIVAFLVAYGPGINSSLVSLMAKSPPQPILGTVLAALLISGLAITAFRSIYLLYRSIDTYNPDDESRSEKRYGDGRDLFLLVILGSAFYVLENIISIVHYAIWHANVPDIEPLDTIIVTIFFIGWVFFVVILPSQLIDSVRKIRHRLGAWSRWVVAGLFAVVDVALAGIESYPLQWPWFLLSAALAVSTVVAFWMLMMPEYRHASA